MVCSTLASAAGRASASSPPSKPRAAYPTPAPHPRAPMDDDDLLGDLLGRLSAINVSNGEELARQFAGVLAISLEEAQFFLSAANNNLEIAVNLYLDATGGGGGGGGRGPAPSPRAAGAGGLLFAPPQMGGPGFGGRPRPPAPSPQQSAPAFGAGLVPGHALVFGGPPSLPGAGAGGGMVPPPAMPAPSWAPPGAPGVMPAPGPGFGGFGMLPPQPPAPQSQQPPAPQPQWPPGAGFR